MCKLTTFYLRTVIGLVRKINEYFDLRLLYCEAKIEPIVRRESGGAGENACLEGLVSVFGNLPTACSRCNDYSAHCLFHD